MSLGIEPPHVEEPQIGAAAAPGAEDPSADRERLDVVEREFSHRAPISKRSGLGKRTELCSCLPDLASKRLGSPVARFVGTAGWGR
jgi:L-alanine-DL-glutamate epimerase-like enolase superfamily enzyme